MFNGCREELTDYIRLSLDTDSLALGRDLNPCRTVEAAPAIVANGPLAERGVDVGWY
jgi:hypothetical protein